MVAVLAIAGCGGDDDDDEPEAAATGATLASAAALDEQALTVTLPLEEGRTADGEPTFYVVTDSSDEADAEERGVNFAPKLANAIGTKAVQEATEEDGAVVFPGTVDFAPEGSIEPGPDGFPPKSFEPGAVGDDAYSPLVTTDGETVINASQVANDTGMSDSVVSIDETNGEVTLKLLDGFVNGKRVLYLRTDASIELVAAAEESTFAPNLNEAPGLADNGTESARSAILPIVNGARTGPERQGLQSALLGEGSPLNVQQESVESPGYSPIWDVTPVVWSDGAEPRRVTSAQEIAGLAEAGDVTSGGEGPANPSVGGLKALEAISNCSTVAEL